MVDWTPVYTRAWSGTPGLTGLIDAIGTNDGVDAYVNPSPSIVTASQSTNQDGTRTADKAFDHSNTPETSETHTTDAANSWWQVDFKDLRVVLTRVGLWNRSASGQHPRYFTIQGSEDGTSWTDLLTVSNPSSADGTWWTGEITSTTLWSHVRVLQTGTNTSGANYLVLGEVEFWGELLEPSGPPVPALVGHEAARVLRQGTDVPVRVGHEAARVLRQGTDVPVRVGHTAARVLREQGGIPVRVGHESARVLRSAQPVGTNALITSDTGVVLDRNSTSSPSSAVFVVHNPRDSGDVTVQIPNGLWGRATLMNLVVHGYVAPVDPEDFGDWEPIMSRVGNHTHDAADIVSGTLNADRLPVQDGLVVKSPDGSRWRISVDDVGDLSVNPL